MTRAFIGCLLALVVWFKGKWAWDWMNSTAQAIQEEYDFKFPWQKKKKA